MLPKKGRLSAAEFKEVFKGGRTLHSKNFLIKFIKTDKEGGVSVAVPKKKVNLSAKRNKFRRRVYKTIGDNWEMFPDKTRAIFVLKNEDLPRRKLLESEIQKILGKLS